MIAFFVLFYVLPVQAALPTNTVWEVRTAGADTSGGCYITGSSGTDYSQQDAAHESYTDINLATTTTMTSAAFPFAADDVGNCIHLTAGAGCTVGFYRIVSVAVVTATVDRAAGTIASTCTGAVGGAVQTPQTPAANFTAGNTIYMKADGTYTVTTTTSIGPNSATGNALSWLGYTTVRGDNGVATWTTATDSTPLITFALDSAGYIFRNFLMTNTASVRAEGFTFVLGIDISNVLIQNVHLDGMSRGIGGATTNNALVHWYLIQVEIENSSIDGIFIDPAAAVTGGLMFFQGVWIHDNAGDGLEIGTGNNFAPSLVFVNCVVANNGANGILLTGGAQGGGAAVLTMINSVVEGNTSDGIEQSNANQQIVVLSNTILWDNGAFGVTLAAASLFSPSFANGYEAGALNNFTAGVGDVTITVDPFTNSAAGDYSLNNTAGGGAALRAAGFPGVSLFGTGYPDIGALQSQAQGSTPVSFGFAQ